MNLRPDGQHPSILGSSAGGPGLLLDGTEAGSTVIVVGAGPAGCLMAINLARRGHRVTVCEVRGDLRSVTDAQHRAINLTLATRGLSALAEVGLLETVLSTSVPLRGRMVHDRGPEVSFQSYGVSADELLYSVRRDELNATLIEAALAQSNLEIRFDTRCTRVDRQSGDVFLTDQRSDRQHVLRADHIVGADGAFSVVRQHMQRGLGAEYWQESLPWGYKELVIPAHLRGAGLAADALHVWPRGHRLLLAIPNLDGSFLCTCVLPFRGPDSFESLTGDRDVLTFLRATFGEEVASIPGLVEQFLHNPTASFVTIRTSPWHYEGRVLLVGDSCHAVYPFYGQGLNAALEDCSIWNRCLDAHSGDWGRAATAYEALRRPGTNALALLSKENFVELRDTSRSRLVAARRSVALALGRCLPTIWMPLYTMVSHTTMGYDAAVRRAERQNRIARWLGLDVLVWMVAMWTALRRRPRLRGPIRAGARSVGQRDRSLVNRADEARS